MTLTAIAPSRPDPSEPRRADRRARAEVAVRLRRPGQPGSIPAVAVRTAARELEIRCTRIALLALYTAPGNPTPDTIPALDVCIDLPRLLTRFAAPLASRVTRIAEMDGNELVLTVLTEGAYLLGRRVPARRDTPAPDSRDVAA